MLGILGCGNMGQAIIKGLKSKKRAKIIAFDVHKARLSRVKKRFRIKTARNSNDLVSSSKVILIAVKPQDIAQALRQVKDSYSNQLIISIAAGISTSFVEKKLGKRVRVIRVMPNLAAKVSMGVCAISKGRYATRKDLSTVKNIFNAVGITVVLNEKQINSVTAVSGSGPGYIYYFLESLEQAAIKLGLSPALAHKLVFHTAKGAVSIMSEGDSFSNLIKQVASRKGTTEAALKYLNSQKFKKTVNAALERAKKRAQQLSK